MHLSIYIQKLDSFSEASGVLQWSLMCLLMKGSLLARLHEKKRVQDVPYEGFSEMVIVSETEPLLAFTQAVACVSCLWRVKRLLRRGSHDVSQNLQWMCLFMAGEQSHVVITCSVQGMDLQSYGISGDCTISLSVSHSEMLSLCFRSFCLELFILGSDLCECKLDQY